MQALLAERVRMVGERIAAAAARGGRAPSDVTVVAVVKTVSPDTAREALSLGLTNLGENRVQEGLRMQSALGRTAATWHFIGTLQANKAQRAAETFDLIHSLDRWDLALVLAQAGRRLGRPIPVLIQVNVSGEAAKHGVAPAELLPFVARVLDLPELRPSGLMTMAPFTEAPEETRPVFRRLHTLFGAAGKEFGLGGDWQWLSMGMSQDYQVAVEEGANLVRIGTAIFGLP